MHDHEVTPDRPSFALAPPPPLQGLLVDLYGGIDQHRLDGPSLGGTLGPAASSALAPAGRVRFVSRVDTCGLFDHRSGPAGGGGGDCRGRAAVADLRARTSRRDRLLRSQHDYLRRPLSPDIAGRSELARVTVVCVKADRVTVARVATARGRDRPGHGRLRHGRRGRGRPGRGRRCRPARCRRCGHQADQRRWILRRVHRVELDAAERARLRPPRVPRRRRRGVAPARFSPSPGGAASTGPSSPRLSAEATRGTGAGGGPGDSGGQEAGSDMVGVPSR